MRLAHTPTPLDELVQLGTRLGTQVFLKRDDLTGLALGGDKPRKLEFELAQARAAGADTIVTCGSAQSNHARITAAAARSLGLDAAVVLSRDAYAAPQGNLLTVHLFGAEVHLIDVEDHWDLEKPALELCDELRARSRRPHYIPVSGTTPYSCLGYVRGGFELVDQLRGSGLHPSAIYTPFGTGGIFAATLLALRTSGFDTPMIGISVNRDRSTCLQNFRHWTGELRRLLRIADDSPLGDYEVHDEFVGREYGDPTSESLDAIVLMARTDGVLLDPVYTGKMAAGFLAHHRAGRWRSDDRIVLLHSGGVPALFAYSTAITAHLARRETNPARPGHETGR